MGLKMYILTTVEFPKHNHDFHLLTKNGSANILLEYHNFMSNNMPYKN